MHASTNVTLKVVIIGTLMMLMLIPALMVMVIVDERERRGIDAIKEVQKRWGGSLQLGGLIVSIPVETTVVEDEESFTTTDYFHFLADHLKVDAALKSQELMRGIYKVPVFQSKVRYEGDFVFKLKHEKVLANQKWLWDQAIVSFMINDLRGIKNDSPSLRR